MPHKVESGKLLQKTSCISRSDAYCTRVKDTNGRAQVRPFDPGSNLCDLHLYAFVLFVYLSS